MAQERCAVNGHKALTAAGAVTLVTATKELDLSHLAVLADLLEAER